MAGCVHRPVTKGMTMMENPIRPFHTQAELSPLPVLTLGRPPGPPGSNDRHAERDAVSMATQFVRPLNDRNNTFKSTPVSRRRSDKDLDHEVDEV